MADNKILLNLKRGTTGLGFNIVGGTDMPNHEGDCGIFVSKIKKDGAAFIDGTLKIGDRILELNSVNLESVTHAFAVQTFLDAGNDVKLMIERKEVASQPSRLAEFLKISLPLVAVMIGVGLVALFVIKNKD